MTVLWFCGEKLFIESASGKEHAYSAGRCKRCRLDLWLKKTPWRGAWQPSPVSLPGESYGQRRLVGYGSWGPSFLKDTTEAT